MRGFINFFIGALVCHIAYLFYFDFNAQTSPDKRVITAYNSEQECNKHTGLDCVNEVSSFYKTKE